VQEALNDQVQDLQERLAGFEYFGVGRDDGKTAGEYAAIFYRSTRFVKLQSSTFWLSETPTIAGSKGWDAAITRIVGWIKLKDLLSGKIFFVFNTHFDHMGQEARRQSAHMLLRFADSIAGNTNAIITGDFNATLQEEPIKIITNATDKRHFTDTKSVSKLAHYGPEGTFNGFEQKEKSSLPIDHIFIKGNFEVLKHATLSESWNGRFSSDHFPVFCRLQLQ
jgi:endonuclease/exonuclease/phosphatase family metal-dependent hydrolase